MFTCVRHYVISISLAFLAGACATQVTATQIPSQTPAQPANTSQPPLIQSPTTFPTRSQTISCDNWQSWPVIPIVSKTAHELYQRGQADGDNPRAFSKIGDGEISTAWFFTAFDLGEDYYDLGWCRGQF